MDVFELKSALEGMVVSYDSREQDTPRLRARIAQMGCKAERSKLDFGDYTAKFPLANGKWFSLEKIVAIERKMNLDELAHCYCQDRKRFESEFVRASKANAKLYLLIENADWEKAYAGEYRSRVNPNALIASALAWLARYNCQIIMCRERTTGRLIHDILYREGKERLEQIEI